MFPQREDDKACALVASSRLTPAGVENLKMIVSKDWVAVRELTVVLDTIFRKP